MLSEVSSLSSISHCTRKEVFKPHFPDAAVSFSWWYSLHEKCLYWEFFLVRIQSEWGKIRTRKTPNMDPFHTVTPPISSSLVLPEMNLSLSQQCHLTVTPCFWLLMEMFAIICNLTFVYVLSEIWLFSRCYYPQKIFPIAQE